MWLICWKYFNMKPGHSAASPLHLDRDLHTHSTAVSRGDVTTLSRPATATSRTHVDPVTSTDVTSRSNDRDVSASLHDARTAAVSRYTRSVPQTPPTKDYNSEPIPRRPDRCDMYHDCSWWGKVYVPLLSSVIKIVTNCDYS